VKDRQIDAAIVTNLLGGKGIIACRCQCGESVVHRGNMNNKWLSERSRKQMLDETEVRYTIGKRLDGTTLDHASLALIQIDSWCLKCVLDCRLANTR
jgi:hypothetical protein